MATSTRRSRPVVTKPAYNLDTVCTTVGQDSAVAVTAAPLAVPALDEKFVPVLGKDYLGHAYDPCVHAVETIYTPENVFLGTIEHRHHERQNLRLHARAFDGTEFYVSDTADAVRRLLAHRAADRPRTIVKTELPWSIHNRADAVKVLELAIGYLNNDESRY